jgi:protein-S-isoprenylcysteine O-methyltransferase Ste14
MLYRAAKGGSSFHTNKTSNFLVLVSLPAFVLYMNCFQILPEERVLASRFARD